MKKLLNWLVVSSANPNAVSMTVRGSLVGIIPVLLFVGQQFNWYWTEQALTETIQAISAFISAFFVLFGFVRKLVLMKK